MYEVSEELIVTPMVANVRERLAVRKQETQNLMGEDLISGS